MLSRYFPKQIAVALSFLFLFSDLVNAQVQPDSTLGAESSAVRPNQIVKGVPSDVISGGAVRGTNLFHSFENFNINSGGGAYFTNPSGITNILTRVTGNNPSNIFGVLGVLGNANLFFINPHGIIFGPNASLALNGSFLATTANRINLSTNTVFSATNPQPVPLLTINRPIGLDFGGNPGNIEVQGSGHNLFNPGSQFLPALPLGGSVPVGLEVRPGYTLALVGGDIRFTGGILTAPGGIEIGSISFGHVSITPNFLRGFSLGYEGVKEFQNISLTRQSLLNSSGTQGGNIEILAKNIELTDKSLVFIENQGVNLLGAINVNASDSLTITGSTQFTPTFAKFANLSGGLISQTLSSGKGADINVATKQLLIQNSGFIGASTFGSASSGNVNIKGTDSVQLLGKSPLDPYYPLGSLIVTTSAKEGSAGNLELTTKQLSLQDGGELGSVIFNSGSGGDVRVNASKAITLTGFEPASLIASTISSATQGSGKGGNLFINTKQLTLEEGGRVDASTVNSGPAGNLIINATDFIKVNGTIPGSDPSFIISSASLLNTQQRNIIGLPGVFSASSGNVIINTNQLSVTNGAQVTVRNDSIGNAGTLRINANSINLDNQGGITASTVNGSGGNIFLHLANQLSLDHNSLITATAGGQGTGGNITIDPQQTVISNGSGIAVNSTGTGKAGQLNISSNNLTLNNGGYLSANTKGGEEGGNIFLNAQNLQLRHSSLFTAAAQDSGNGGNITINTGTLAALENSNIRADADRGNGGNIQINTQGLFQSPDSKFTASSNLGINGTVRVNTVVNTSTLGLVQLPIVPVDAAKLIAAGCGGNTGSRGNSFVVTGSGGFPTVPTELQASNTVWADIGADAAPTSVPLERSDIENAVPSTEYQYKGGPLVEAQGWVTNSKGEIVMTANAPTYTPAAPWIKPPSCQVR